MRKMIIELIAKNLAGYRAEDIQTLVEIPTIPENGDFALPCFTIAKTLRKSPNLIAEELKAAIEKEQNLDFIRKMEVVNGYLNFHMEREVLIDNLFSEFRKGKDELSKEGSGKTICIDYSSPNIAKNFHVGHLRTTLIGNSLYKIYEKLGFHVVRINHLGDWGTQFGKLIVAYKLWSSKEQVETDGIQELLRIYVKFNEEAENSAFREENKSLQKSDLKEEARMWFAKMEQGDEEALAIWQWFKEISMVEFDRIYQLLGIEFDYYIGESFYMDKVPALVKELKEKNLLVESQGANIIDLSQENMPPCLITKKDGSSIYHSRDIAAVLYRKKEYQFDRCLYVTGSEQSLHFAQVFQAIKLMGYDWYDDLVHVPYGLVRLDGEKLSTRNGNIIYAEDILREAVTRVSGMMEQKGTELANKEQIAKMVGIGAIIFHDLFHQRIKNVDFSWKEVLNFDGSTGPYVQYTYARAKSILRKAGKDPKNQSIDTHWMTDDSSYNLIKVLAYYHDTMKEAAQRYEPSVIARYTIALSTAFNQFYRDCNILNAEEGVKEARLYLVTLTQEVIKDAMGLLGIECPEEM